MSDTSTLGTKAVSRFGAPRQKVPPFARYKGTSVWRKNRIRAREYARYLAAEKQASATQGG
jgi:hypothetical protein